VICNELLRAGLGASKVGCNVRSSRSIVLAIVCLGITAPGVGWAEPAHSTAPADGDPADDPDAADTAQSPAPQRADSFAGGAGVPGIEKIQDPYAPHDPSGSEVRFGTTVGFFHGEPIDAIAVGVTTAIGQRFGRLTIEAEFDWMAVESPRNSVRIGDAERLGGLGRLDVVRLGPHQVGRNSMLALYVEGGAAIAWNHWYQPRLGQPMHVVPDDTRRVEGQLGFGFLLDHRAQEQSGFPRRVGWFLGWRMGLLPQSMEPEPVCRSTGTACRVSQPRPAADQPVERSLLFQSSLAMTW
jgi:hypothetical protein